MPDESSNHSIRETHPLFAQEEAPSWVTLDDPHESLRTARNALFTALREADEKETELERRTNNTQAGIPLISLRLSGQTLSEGSLIRGVLDQFNAEIHNPRLWNGHLDFDVFVPPDLRAGAVGQIRDSGTAPLSKYVSVTNALRRAGFRVGDEIRMGVRPNEVRLWDGSLENAPYRAASPVMSTTSPPTISSDTVNAFASELIYGSEWQTNVNTTRYPPRVTVHAPLEEVSVLHHTLATAPVSIRRIWFGDEEISITVKLHSEYDTVTTGRNSLQTKVRQINPDSCAITLTNALETAGLSHPGEQTETTERVAVFSRPGELRIIPAAPQQRPLGLD